MVQFPNIGPVAVRIGPFAIRWYGLMYLVGFLSSYLLVRFQLSIPCGPAADEEAASGSKARQPLYRTDHRAHRGGPAGLCCSSMTFARILPHRSRPWRSGTAACPFMED